MSEISINKRTEKDGTESITYSKSWEKDGLNYRKEVRKVEGGYIVTESKHGNPKGEDEGWIDERRESVTTENPLDAAENKSDDEKMFDFIDSPLM